jgi:hypothetical protein
LNNQTEEGLNIFLNNIEKFKKQYNMEMIKWLKRKKQYMNIKILS